MVFTGRFLLVEGGGLWVEGERAEQQILRFAQDDSQLSRSTLYPKPSTYKIHFRKSSSSAIDFSRSRTIAGSTTTRDEAPSGSS